MLFPPRCFPRWPRWGWKRIGTVCTTCHANLHARMLPNNAISCPMQTGYHMQSLRAETCSLLPELLTHIQAHLNTLTLFPSFVDQPTHLPLLCPPSSLPPQLQQNDQVKLPPLKHLPQLQLDEVPLPPKQAKIYKCDCCRRQQSFHSKEELRVHQRERPFICGFCPKRFKRENEAKRHENTYHNPSYPWPCAKLATANAAFHPSRDSLSNICGYCGSHFPVSASQDTLSKHVESHSFGSCRRKEVFGPDHFQQHLKKVHGASSGSWTKRLEITCESLQSTRGFRGVGLMRVSASGRNTSTPDTPTRI
ncbi:hypothetical protein BU26DRAFT_172152 [Trematosphaeria pertusa]|uniref:C2H2-type domain-containing protein n=1 Tax=Trematosphaeria pertusa TaxID=390896 RepID=A0A6A6HUP8_9PLEO|nr:uncharacterized protein BU26DRAFT_172152 [Trematosphaeria pertusa]KAF2241894.1 hypothetical protein BU26DRAFT_172152 [Trematosphaeria pertusa]